jgi:hypothetical protein
MEGGGYFGVAEGKWGSNREHFYSTASHQQIHLPQTASTEDPKISAYFNVTSTSLR